VAGVGFCVADRWHLLHNLTDAVERVVARHRSCLRAPEPEPEPETPQQQSAAETPSADGPRATRTRTRHREIHALLTTGLSPTEISRSLRLDPKTIRRYAQADTAEELIGINPTGRISTLNPHKAYLRQRFDEGVTSTNRLYAEIGTRGFRGSLRTLRRYTAQLRADLGEAPKPAQLQRRNHARSSAGSSAIPTISPTPTAPGWPRSAGAARS
jgi:hypothetical protein